MALKDIPLFATRAALSFVLFSLIFFSITDFRTENILESLYEDIYDHANPKSQKKVIENLNGLCTKEVHNEEGKVNMTEICDQKSSLSDKQFFSKFLMTVATDSQLIDLDIESETSFLNIPFSVIAVFLLIVLTILQKFNISEISRSLGRILFSIGMFFVLAYAFVFIYNTAVKADTTSILNSFSEPADNTLNMDKVLPIMIPLVITGIFTKLHLFVGLACIIIAVILKFIFAAFRKRSTSNI
jgi:hypothetical protein